MVSSVEIEIWAAGQPEVTRWLERFSVTTRQQYLRAFYLFFKHLKSKQGYENVTVPALIEYARKDPFEVFDAVQDFVLTAKGAKSYKAKTYGAVNSFFLHNRACICESCMRMRSAIRDEPALPSLSNLEMKSVS